METSNNFTNKPYAGDNTSRKKTNTLTIVIVVLSVIVMLLGILLFSESKKLDVTTEERELITEEKMRLENQLTGLILEYDSLRTENDSINNLLAAEQHKIKQILSRQASDTEKIRLYRNELETLRKVMRSYIIQIDSLNTRNQELTEENIIVRTQLRTTELDLTEVKKEREDLTQKVTKASVLSAKNILAEGINRSGKTRDRHRSVEKLRVCFTIRENAISGPGSKMIYLRLVRPDNIVLASVGETAMITVENEQLVYSAKRELEYENRDIDMCIYWDKTDELISGNYKVFLYAEGFMIGESSFILK